MLKATVMERHASPTVSEEAIPRRHFLEAMGEVASGVTVVATDGPGGQAGQTVSSFCSVSADPPQLLACVRRVSPLCSAIEKNERFAVNVLSVSQRAIADAFAGASRSLNPYDFAAFRCTNVIGCPTFDGATAIFGCLLVDRLTRDSHTIYIGEVIDLLSTKQPPLLYRQRRYGIYAPNQCERP